MPGSISPATGLVKNANSTWLIGHPLQPICERALGREVRLANDANCFALSEATDGAARGRARRVRRDPRHRHRRRRRRRRPRAGGCRTRSRASGGTTRCRGPTRDEWPGPPCYCGRRGCIETFLSGSGLQSLARHGSVGGRSPRARSPRAAAARRCTPPRPARRDLQRAAWRSRWPTVINLLDPDVIVLGGGLSNIESLYRRVPRDLDGLGLLGSRRHAPRARAARRFERRARRGVALGHLAEGFARSGSSTRSRCSARAVALELRRRASDVGRRASSTALLASIGSPATIDHPMQV